MMEISAHAPCRILAVAALYKQSPSESHALASFLQIMKESPALARHLSLLVYDNSPDPQEMPHDIGQHYRHDPGNGGLATAYNYALAHAEQAGDGWLLLLDQDTTVTREFLAELVACAESLPPEDPVVAIVPKLMVQGAIQSPAEHFIDYMRHQFTRSLHTLSEESGVQPGRISAYNSGSTLSVGALRSIGGFPQEFWLDYLDHAVFHSLCARGGQVFVLHAVLTHHLAESDLNGRPLWRFRNALKAQALFVTRAGTLVDRLLYRLWLLRSLRRLRADLRDQRIWKETAMQALFVHTAKSLAPVRPPLPATHNPH